MKKYREYIKEELNPNDPYNEEEWDDSRKKIIPDVYVVYVIGQDMNFLCQKKWKIIDQRRGWRDFYYEMLFIKGGEINFDSKCTVSPAYECHNKEGVLDGTELVGYIKYWNTTSFDTLQNLCDKLRISIDSVKLYTGYN